MNNFGGFGEPSHSSAERQRRRDAEGFLNLPESSQLPYLQPDSDDNSLFIPDSTRRDMLPRNQASRPRRNAGPSSSNRTSFLTPVSSPSARWNAPDVQIKAEEEIKVLEHLKGTPTEQQVKIYVGPGNKIYPVSIRDLDKSPVLMAMISQNSIEGAYIMHPALTEIDPNVFLAVQQFLIMDEYIPAIVSNPQGDNILPKKLDGLNTVEEYREEAVRAGHLYIIAKRLGMSTMEELIFRKITQAEYQQYGIQCHLELAKVVFSRPDDNELLNKVKCRAPRRGHAGEEIEDRLESWLIESLKSRMQAMLLRHGQLFFEVANHGACARRGFELRILKRRVEDLEALGGTITIEDDA